MRSLPLNVYLNATVSATATAVAVAATFCGKLKAGNQEILLPNKSAN